MRTPTFTSIARSSQYGHMIKHLETSHVVAMPIVLPDGDVRDSIGSKAVEAISLRQDSRRTQAKADSIYADLINPGHTQTPQDPWAEVNASDISSGRRRLEGQYYRADYVRIDSNIRSAATNGVCTVDQLTKSVALGNRFKRHYGSKGTPYRSAGELFDVNAPVTKRIYSALLNDPESYMLNPGHIIMARSGQTYGLLGRTMILTERHRNILGSDDFIRIEPDLELVRTGYLHTVLSHQEYGRPMIIRHASGTSIPHLDPIDIAKVPVPRFDPSIEARIADLSETASEQASRADTLESEATDEAEKAIAEALGDQGFHEG